MDTLTTIRFRPIDIDSVSEIAPLLKSAGSRTCDYTIAGIMMWSDYFHYQYAVLNDTLFIKGVAENDITKPAFSMPIGAMPLSESIGMIRDYCREQGLPVRFSAVPEDRLKDFYCLGACRIEELEDWADYLYLADDLVNLSGNRYNKKRNHVHRFINENPDWKFELIDEKNLPAVKKFFMEMATSDPKTEGTEGEERFQVYQVLENYDRYPFEGGVLYGESGRPVAFTIGEVIGDTLFVHIEKMDHTVAGAGETINKMFATAMKEKYGIVYINREEDVGDEGLRKAKQSYHPAMMLKKYNLTVDE